MAKLTYEIEMSPENAGKIDAINKILLGDAYTEEAPPKTSTAKTTKAEEQREASTAKASYTLSLDDVKAAAKAAKAEFGEEFAMQVLKDAGVKVATTLGRSMSAIDEEQYEEVITAWEAGPQQTEQSDDTPDDDDDFGDDDDGLDDDSGEVDAEAVKTALKAYSKEHGRDEAKAIMTKHGAASLSKVDDLPAKKLAAMMKDLV